MSVTAEVKRHTFQVREKCDVEVAARSSQDLKPGDTVEFQFPNTWLMISGPSFTRALQCEDPNGEHYINVTAPESDAEFELQIRSRHLYYPEKGGRHGKHVVATLTEGVVAANSPIHILYGNTFAPYVSETETVWLRVKGEVPDADPTLIITPGPAEHLRIIAPSGVEPGQSFEVLVVSLDKFDNCSSTEYSNQTLKTVEGKVVAEALSFVGSIRVPVRLEAEGIHRFVMGDVVSNALRVAKGCRGPYWGDIHIHTKLSGDGQGTEPYRYAREVSGLDFAGIADHCESLGELGYQQALQWANDAYQPGKFVTVLGDERNPEHFTGHHNIYFRDQESFLKFAYQLGTSPVTDGKKDIEKALDPSASMLVPHHTGISWRQLPKEGIGSAVDLQAVDDQGLRPVVEIYSHHGQSDTYAPQHILAYEFNRMRNPERRSNTSTPGPYYAQGYWASGARLGVIASSDEHSGQGGRRHGGIAALWCEELTRAGVFDAIRERRCYATTGERILLDFSVDDLKMGQCGQRQKGDKVRIRLQVRGTAPLLRVELLRYRVGLDSSFVSILSECPRPESMDARYETEDDLAGSSIYYARVTQQPLNWPGMAWSSPVWIDVE